MPPLAVGIIWAVLSALGSLGFAYPTVVKKVHNQGKYQEGGIRAQVNQGRMVALLVSFVLSAVLMAGLFFALSEWGWLEWLLALLAIPGFFLVSLGWDAWVRRQWSPLFQRVASVRGSLVVLGILLLLIYWLMLALGPAPDPVSATEAFLSTPQPFEESPTVLLAEGGKLSAFVHGMTAYGLSVVASYDSAWYYAIKAVMAISALFGLASLLGTCSLEPSEIKHIPPPCEQLKRRTSGRSQSGDTWLPLVCCPWFWWLASWWRTIRLLKWQRQRSTRRLRALFASSLAWQLPISMESTTIPLR